VRCGVISSSVISSSAFVAQSPAGPPGASSPTALSASSQAFRTPSLDRLQVRLQVRLQACLQRRSARSMMTP
jgi:hypothetical protein